jgi:hypothetical protein
MSKHVSNQASPGRLHRRRHPHPGRQGATRRVPQYPSRRHARARAAQRDRAGTRHRRQPHRRRRSSAAPMPEGRARHERRAHRPCCWPACPNTVAAQTINRFCSSGLQAVRPGGRPDPPRQRRSHARRRYRIDVDGADDGQQGRVEPERLPSDDERRDRLRHGHHRREVAEEWKDLREDQDCIPRWLRTRSESRRIQSGEFTNEISV